MFRLFWYRRHDAYRTSAAINGERNIFSSSKRFERLRTTRWSPPNFWIFRITIWFVIFHQFATLNRFIRVFYCFRAIRDVDSLSSGGGRYAGNITFAYRNKWEARFTVLCIRIFRLIFFKINENIIMMKKQSKEKVEHWMFKILEITRISTNQRIQNLIVGIICTKETENVYKILSFGLFVVFVAVTRIFWN